MRKFTILAGTALIGDWLLTTLGYEPLQEWDEGISWTLRGAGHRSFTLRSAPTCDARATRR